MILCEAFETKVEICSPLQSSHFENISLISAMFPHNQGSGQIFLCAQFRLNALETGKNRYFPNGIYACKKWGSAKSLFNYCAFNKTFRVPSISHYGLTSCKDEEEKFLPHVERWHL